MQTHEAVLMRIRGNFIGMVKPISRLKVTFPVLMGMKCQNANLADRARSVDAIIDV